MLPFTTRILDAADYGGFALANGYAAFGLSLASVGLGLIFAKYFIPGEDDKCRRVVSTVTSMSMIAVVAYSLVVLAISAWLPGHESLKTSNLLWVLLSMALGQPWFIAAEVLTAQSQPKWYAIISILQTVVTSISQLILLFHLGFGVEALFIAQFFGSLVAIAGAAFVLKRFFSVQLDREILSEIKSLGFWSVLGNLVEAFKTPLERNLIVSSWGSSALGTYSHSQQYRTLGSMIIKSIGRSIWAVELADARSEHGTFKKSEIAWSTAFILATMMGLFFATLGESFISWLTNGKFPGAGLLTTAWMIFLLMQNTGRPQNSVIFARGGGVKFSRLVVYSHFSAVIGFLIFVPWLGVLGGVLANLVQMIFLRLGTQILSKHYRKTPFTDQWAYVGSLIIVGVYLVNYYFCGSLSCKVLLFSGSLLALLVSSRKTLMPAFEVLKSNQSS